MRSKLSLNTKEILENPFLVGDFIFEEEKRKKLEDSDTESLESFFTYLQVDDNIDQLVNLFKDGHYERYYNFKHGQGKFEEFTKWLVGQSVGAPVFFISRVIANFIYSEASMREGVEEFKVIVRDAFEVAVVDEKETRERMLGNLEQKLNNLGY